MTIRTYFLFLTMLFSSKMFNPECFQVLAGAYLRRRMIRTTLIPPVTVQFTLAMYSFGSDG